MHIRICLLVFSLFFVSLYSAPTPSDPNPTESSEIQTGDTQVSPALSTEKMSQTIPAFDEGDENEGMKKSHFMEEFTHMLLSLGFIIVLILIAGWILKRFVNQRLVQMNSSSIIKIIERRALSAKTALYLIEIEGKEILIAESATAVHSLAEFPATTPSDESQTLFKTVYDTPKDIPKS